MLWSITIKGHLDQRWSDWFDGLSVTHQENGETVLSGYLPDQASLHSVLARARDLGLVLVAVECQERCSGPGVLVRSLRPAFSAAG